MLERFKTVAKKSWLFTWDWTFPSGVTTQCVEHRPLEAVEATRTKTIQMLDEEVIICSNCHELWSLFTMLDRVVNDDDDDYTALRSSAAKNWTLCTHQLARARALRLALLMLSLRQKLQCSANLHIRFFFALLKRPVCFGCWTWYERLRELCMIVALARRSERLRDW